MQRPSHIPVCRLSQIVAAAQPTCWRRAQAGDYGPVTRDERGRQSVSIAAVEDAEGVRFNDARVAAALSTPGTNVVRERLKQERLRNLSPGPITIEPWPQDFYTRSDALAFALSAVRKRDEMWLRYLAVRKPGRPPQL